VCLEEIRELARHRPMAPLDLDGPPSEDASLRRVAARLESEEELSKLAPDERELLVKRAGEERTLAELAQESGESVSTLHDRFVRALSKVRSGIKSLTTRRFRRREKT